MAGLGRAALDAAAAAGRVIGAGWADAGTATDGVTAGLPGGGAAAVADSETETGRRFACIMGRTVRVGDGQSSRMCASIEAAMAQTKRGWANKRAGFRGSIRACKFTGLCYSSPTF